MVSHTRLYLWNWMYSTVTIFHSFIQAVEVLKKLRFYRKHVSEAIDLYGWCPCQSKDIYRVNFFTPLHHPSTEGHGRGRMNHGAISNCVHTLLWKCTNIPSYLHNIYATDTFTCRLGYLWTTIYCRVRSWLTIASGCGYLTKVFVSHQYWQQVPVSERLVVPTRIPFIDAASSHASCSPWPRLTAVESSCKPYNKFWRGMLRHQFSIHYPWPSQFRCPILPGTWRFWIKYGNFPDVICNL